MRAAVDDEEGELLRAILRLAEDPSGRAPPGPPRRGLRRDGALAGALRTRVRRGDRARGRPPSLPPAAGLARALGYDPLATPRRSMRACAWG